MMGNPSPSPGADCCWCCWLWWWVVSSAKSLGRLFIEEDDEDDDEEDEEDEEGAWPRPTSPLSPSPAPWLALVCMSTEAWKLALVCCEAVNVALAVGCCWGRGRGMECCREGGGTEVTMDALPMVVSSRDPGTCIKDDEEEEEEEEYSPGAVPVPPSP